MNKFILTLVLTLAFIPFWKCPINYYGGPEDPTIEEEQGYFILNCSFHQTNKDRNDCNDLAKYLKCNPYNHKKVKSNKRK